MPKSLAPILANSGSGVTAHASFARGRSCGQPGGLHARPARRWGTLRRPDQPVCHCGSSLEAKAAALERDFARPASYAEERSSGNLRGRLPVKAATALAIAGAIGGTPGSPKPVGGS